MQVHVWRLRSRVLGLTAGKRAGSVAPWGDETIFADLKSDTSLDEVKTSKFVDRITDLYALIFEVDEWEAAHGGPQPA